MRVLWITNVKVEKNVSDCKNFRGGWMVGALEFLLNSEDVQLAIAFPNGKEEDLKERNAITYYSFYYDLESTAYDANLQRQILSLYQKYSPDIIHIWGTEYMHAYTATEAAKIMHLEKKVVINIQGMVSVYCKHYALGIEELLKKRTLYEIVKKRGIKQQKDSFERRGEFEKKAIRNARHAVGRTNWDKACVLQINPNIIYHYGGEIMRSPFYGSEAWNVNQCEKHTVFVSQAVYPIKGLHFLLDALAIIKQYYPDVIMNIAAENIFQKASRLPFAGSQMLLSTYERKLYKKIVYNHLENNISFLGGLSALQMKEQYLKANVVVSASTIENSSNSITEAMLLGVPVVSSFVGGIPDLIEHKVNGFMYPCDEPYMLAYYVMELFSNDKMANNISANARRCARDRNDINNNGNILLDTYKQVKCDE